MTLLEFCRKQGAGAVGKQIWPDLSQQFPNEMQIPRDKRNDATYEAALAWANITYDTDEFVEIAYRYFFKYDEDAMQFKLAWCV